ncbi:DNA-directed RNA polymerase [Vibrio breoganii]
MNTLMQQQIELEKRKYEEGYQQHMKQFEESKRTKTLGMSKASRAFINKNIVKLAEAITRDIAENKGRRGPNNLLTQYLGDFEDEDLMYRVASIVLRQFFDNLYTVDILPMRYCQKLGLSVRSELSHYIYMNNADERSVAKLTERLAKRKSNQKRQTCLRHAIRNEGVYDVQMNEETAIVVGHNLMRIMSLTLPWFCMKVKMERQTTSKGGYTVKRKDIYHIYPEFIEAFEKLQGGILMHTPIAHTPMSMPPRDWSPKNVAGGAYLTERLSSNFKMVLRSWKADSRSIQTSEMPKFYDALNRAQRTDFRVNKKMLEVYEQIIDSQLHYSQALGLPDFNTKTEVTREEAIAQMQLINPKPVCVADDSPEMRRYLWEASKYFNKLKQTKCELSAFLGLVHRAQEYGALSAFWTPYQVDSRGRFYSATSLSMQKADHVKALMQFGEGKKLGDNGLYWLYVQMANVYGQDKLSLDDRVQWVADNLERIKAFAVSPYDDKAFWLKADKKMQSLACAIEIQEAHELEDHREYVSRIPVALDGSCSGLQILGAMLRCEETGLNVNLMASEGRHDIYGNVADAVRQDFIAITEGAETYQEAIVVAVRKAREAYAETKLPSTAFDSVLSSVLERKVSTLSSDERMVRTAFNEVKDAYAWLALGFDRKVTKQSVMTYSYSATVGKFQEQLLEDFIKPAYKLALEDSSRDWLFSGDGFMGAWLMARAIMRNVEEQVIRASQAMHYFQKVSALIGDSGIDVKWKTPLGFTCNSTSFKSTKKTTECFINGTSHRPIYHILDTDCIDTNAIKRSIAPNIVHSLDSALLQTIVNLAYEKYGIRHFSLIHDSFGTHAGNTEVFFKCIREAFIELFAENDVFDDIATQLEALVPESLKGVIPPRPTYGNLDVTEILHSEYAFA